MGFIFYIADFWLWRWMQALEFIRLRMKKEFFLGYYVNWFFMIFLYAQILKRTLGRLLGW